MGLDTRFSDMRGPRTASSMTPWSVLWTYDLWAHPSPTIEQWAVMEARLDRLLDELPPAATDAHVVQRMFDDVVCDFETVIGSELDEGGVFEYGGLNDFFGEIMRRYGLPVEIGEFFQTSNFVYPGIGGR